MEVGGKQCWAPDLLHEMLRNGPGEAKPIVCGGPPAKLVNDD